MASLADFFLFDLVNCVDIVGAMLRHKVLCGASSKQTCRRKYFLICGACWTHIFMLRNVGFTHISSIFIPRLESSSIDVYPPIVCRWSESNNCTTNITLTPSPFFNANSIADSSLFGDINWNDIWLKHLKALKSLGFVKYKFLSRYLIRLSLYV